MILGGRNVMSDIIGQAESKDGIIWLGMVEQRQE
jgi:hypothetical protein